MDPNENLRRLRALLVEHDERDVDVIAELVTALDEWLSKGGFLPAAWCQGHVQELNTGPEGDCGAVVAIGDEKLSCDLDAPHHGWAHKTLVTADGPPVYWCSDAEAEAVVVE